MLDQDLTGSASLRSADTNLGDVSTLSPELAIHGTRHSRGHSRWHPAERAESGSGVGDRECRSASNSTSAISDALEEAQSAPQQAKTADWRVSPSYFRISKQV